MKKRLGIIFIITLLMSLSAQCYADVSSAAVLFLRIAAGARAAGMGEAFVAVADDATATHWNPAGLGAYPLASKWFEVKIPEEFRSIKKIALLKNDASGPDYQKYDIYGITDSGLVRYSMNKWHRGDLIQTRHDETAESILRKYTGLTSEDDNAKVDSLLDRIGAVNNDFPREKVESFESGVLAAVPEDYDNREDVENALFALKTAYNNCLIDWERFENAQNNFKKGMKDSVLSDSEIDRMLFTLEKSVMKYLPEELLIPYEVNFDGAILDIAESGKYLWLATEKGLLRYNGTSWQKFDPAAGLPAEKITSISADKRGAFLGTENGVVVYYRGVFDLQGPSKGLPSKPVSGLTSSSDRSAWTVIDGDLYKYDGTSWKNYFEYHDVLDMTSESIYDSMKLFNTPNEKEIFIKKYEALNKSEPGLLDLNAPSTQTGIVGLIDSLGMQRALKLLQDSLAILKVEERVPITESSMPL
jgi:hypothetical protein